MSVEVKKDICSILVTSCDKYEDTWNPFFTLFQIMWPDCPYPLYLNTESKDLTHSQRKAWGVRVLHPSSRFDKRGKEISWSERLKQALEQIDSPYVICLLDDYFLRSPVRVDVIEKCIVYLNEDASVGSFRYYYDPCLDDVVLGEFSTIDPSYACCMNTMAALWRKDALLSILRDENPWDFEIFASARYRDRLQGVFRVYAQSSGDAVFNYSIVPSLGFGVYKGKWLSNNKELFEAYGINVNYENLGVWDVYPTYIAEPRNMRWLIKKVEEVVRHPDRAGHYLMCARNLLDARRKAVQAKYFNP